MRELRELLKLLSPCHRAQGASTNVLTVSLRAEAQRLPEKAATLSPACLPARAFSAYDFLENVVTLSPRAKVWDG